MSHYNRTLQLAHLLKSLDVIYNIQYHCHIPTSRYTPIYIQWASFQEATL